MLPCGRSIHAFFGHGFGRFVYMGDTQLLALIQLPPDLPAATATHWRDAFDAIHKGKMQLIPGSFPCSHPPTCTFFAMPTTLLGTRCAKCKHVSLHTRSEAPVQRFTISPPFLAALATDLLRNCDSEYKNCTYL